MNLLQLFGQRVTCQAISDFPSGDMIGFTKRADHKTPAGQLRICGQAQMRASVINYVFIDFIADDDDVGVLNNPNQIRYIFIPEHRSSWIVRKVKND